MLSTILLLIFLLTGVLSTKATLAILLALLIWGNLVSAWREGN